RGPQQANRRIAEGRHHLRSTTLANPAGILTHRNVSYVVRTILNGPVSPHPFEQLSRISHSPRNTGNEIADLMRGLAVSDHFAFHLSDLSDARPIQILV